MELSWKTIKKIIIFIIGLLSIIFSLTVFILGFEYIRMGASGMLNGIVSEMMNVTHSQENQMVSVIVGLGWFLLIGGFTSFTCSIGWIKSLPLQELIKVKEGENK